MTNIFKRGAAIVYSAVLLFCNCFSAFAEVRLPEGTVAGLPEKLTVMDSDGSAVNGSGEYFFHVEGMSPYTEYSKDIQIMNLREDKAYHIYFYAEPISKSGEIDLEEGCTAVFTLEGKQVFKGSVSGKSEDGTVDLSETPIDLGLYEPGKSRKLNCTVTWDGESAGEFIDYGSKLVDTDGTHILDSGNSQDGEISGETEFRWIFYAAVDESYSPPNTGMFGSESGAYLIAIAAAALMIIIMLLLIAAKKKRANEKTKANEST